ncbi:LuxR family two component transcriptional regulator [Motilibacter rhizosphaerae]|uniref:LuxR family two component transcriptional regulator n=1 Tax=Motilibacter rhizosphaerae TaxID=598652 RepID=A0A4Q7NPS2_9ACTN|nr:response regulator transcription factor [Motilibacter rhizosphaerae]RZS87092.1 LuxR family two component transcriptional regulator [Motilibacter rhizosphaerae]
MSGPAVRVLVVDDHPVVRAGMVTLLTGDGVEVVGEAADGAAAVALAEQLHPDVVLMDLRMPVLDGAAATARIVAGGWSRVLVLTTYDTDGDILRAVEAGATGYLLKDAPQDELLAAIRAAARGETVLAPPVAQRLLTHVRSPARPSLSARELEVLQGVGRGLSNAEIGLALHIGEATVKTHLLRAFAKLEVADRTHAVTRAMELGLLDLTPPRRG